MSPATIEALLYAAGMIMTDQLVTVAYRNPDMWVYPGWMKTFVRVLSVTLWPACAATAVAVMMCRILTRRLR